MGLTATVHRLEVALSDVDRSVYESLDLRVARHPSESARYLWTRALAYCLSYQEGIAFSKGGLSQTDEPPVSIRDATGLLLAWIDVGAPSAERLHKAAKAAERVLVYTHVDIEQLRRDAKTRAVHRADEIEVWRIEPALLDALEGVLEKSTRLELTRNDGRLYVTIGGASFEGEISCSKLAPDRSGEE